MLADYEQDYRYYDVIRFALDDGGGMVDANSNNGIRDKNRFLTRNAYGVFHGSPTWGRDNVVGTYLNTSNNNYVDQFGKLIIPGSTLSFSTSLWLKYGSSFGNYPCVISQLQAGTNIGWGIEVFASTPNHGAPYAIAYDGTHQLNNYSSALPACQDLKWHLIVAVWDRLLQLLKISIDVGPFFTTSISTVGSMTGDGTASFKLGQNTNLGGTDGFVGAIADVRLHTNRILNTMDCLKLYRDKKLRMTGRDLFSQPWLLSQFAAGGGGGAAQQSAVTIIA